jgi:hypothetical protein
MDIQAPFRHSILCVLQYLYAAFIPEVANSLEGPFSILRVISRRDHSHATPAGTMAEIDNISSLQDVKPALGAKDFDSAA